MIKFYNTKMMSPNVVEPFDDPVTPGKGTYAYDKMGIDALKEDILEPDAGIIASATENVITYFESDHPVEKENPHGTTIYNHDYKLEVESSEDALIRESKEMLDAKIRSDVAQLIEPPDDSTEEPTTDPDDPGTSQNV